MKSYERQPGGVATGAYIGTLIVRRPEAISTALQHVATIENTSFEVPIDNFALTRSISNEAGYMLLEGGDMGERRDVFWRGIYLAYAIGVASKPASWPRLRDGHPSGKANAADFRDIMSGVYSMQANVPLSTEIAELGHTVADSYGGYPETAKLGILTGLYFLDNGEREKRLEYEDQRLQAQKEFTQNQFSTIASRLEGQEWEELVQHYEEPTPGYLLEG